MKQQQAEIAELRRMLFGQRSERMPPMEREVRRRRKSEDAEQRRKQTQDKRKRNRDKRKRIPTEKVTHDVDEGDLACPLCDGPFREWTPGEISYEIEYVPAHFVLREHIRRKMICRCGKTIRLAPAHDRVSDGVQYGPGFHAQVVVAKCADSIPLYRQARQLRRAGVPICRSTLGDLFHRSAELLRPLRDHMLKQIAKQRVVNADETTIRRLTPGQSKTHRSYIWTFCTDDLVAYRYTPGRSGKLPETVLGDSEGVIQVDGYTGYNTVCTPEARTRAGCWAHARRYFWKARATDPDDAQWMLDRILDLYSVEYLAAERGILGTGAHLALRQRCSRPVVDEIRLWLEQEQDQAPPKSPLGEAYTYLGNQLDSLVHFLDDPGVGLDNNYSERMLRTVALGRKNFLFVGNDDAGDNLAVLQSLVSTCEIHDINPVEYIADVLMRIQTHPDNRIDELMPANWLDLRAAEAA
jgi:transposase